MKYNLSLIMKKAWVLKKTQGLCLSKALSLSWKEAKEELPQTLRGYLQQGILRFSFIKRDDSLRIARGTTNLSMIPQDKHPKEDILYDRQSQVRYFDLDKNDWRSFNPNRFKAILSNVVEN